MKSTLKNLPTIARNIREKRELKGISQDKLSKLANVSMNTITKIESGDTPNPTIETVKSIAKALDTGVETLLNE